MSALRAVRDEILIQSLRKHYGHYNNQSVTASNKLNVTVYL